jgi:hypothetical protein
MAFYSGTDGRLLIDGQEAARVRSWSYSATQATLDTTSLADTDRTVTEGIRSHSGSCALWYYADDSGNDASTLLRKLIKARTVGADEGIAPESERVTLRLKIQDQTIGGKYIEGEAIITSAALAMSVGEVLSADIAFEFNGAPTEVNI